MLLPPPPGCGVPGFGAPPSVCGGELQRAGRPGAGCWGQAEGWKHPQHPKKSLGGTSPSALTRGKAAEVGAEQVGLQGGPIQRQGPCGGCAAGGSLCFPRLGVLVEPYKEGIAMRWGLSSHGKCLRTRGRPVSHHRFRLRGTHPPTQAFDFILLKGFIAETGRFPSRQMTFYCRV